MNSKKNIIRHHGTLSAHRQKQCTSKVWICRMLLREMNMKYGQTRIVIFWRDYVSIFFFNCGVIQMSCKYCTEFEDLPEHIINGKPVGKVFDTNIDKDENGWHICLSSIFVIVINFCPYCGRKLTEDTTPSTHDVNQWLFSDLDDTIDCF